MTQAPDKALMFDKPCGPNGGGRGKVSPGGMGIAAVLPRDDREAGSSPTGTSRLGSFWRVSTRGPASAPRGLVDASL